MGEILETLWSATNKVAGTTRAMGKSHQSEVLDDNMYDSNQKKWVGIVRIYSRYPRLHTLFPFPSPVPTPPDLNTSLNCSLCNPSKHA